KDRKAITLTKPPPQPPGGKKAALAASVAAPGKSKADAQAEEPYDEALFEKLRALRRELADERKVPAYIVFGDATLRQMARECPTSDDQLSHISGVGDKKRIEFGQKFINVILEHVGGTGTAVPAPRPQIAPFVPPLVHDNAPELNDTMLK